jgi:hypothetical protein
MSATFSYRNALCCSHYKNEGTEFCWRTNCMLQNYCYLVDNVYVYNRNRAPKFKSKLQNSQQTSLLWN